MSKKKFTQNIADILADDLATLESIEPGAVLRPDLMKPQTTTQPPGVEPATEVLAAEAERAATAGSEPAPDVAQTPLPLVDPSEVDQPDLFGGPSETAATLPVEPAAPMPARGGAPRAARPALAEATDAPTPTPGPEPNPAAQPEPMPAALKAGTRPEHAGGGSGSGSDSGDGDDGGPEFTDSVTLVEIAPPDEGGIQEQPLPGDRSLSPPSPPKARRAWGHPVARWAFYVVMVAALTAIFLFVLIDIFHLG